MEWIKNILINYWPQILAIIIFIASFILQLIKKKPVKVIDLIAKCVYDLIPVCINVVEADPTIKGIRKKEKCLQLVEDWFKTNNFEFTSYYKKLASDFIEVVLSTPQKHER